MTKSRILIVEDTPVYVQTLSHILREQRYQLSVAPNGRHALQILEKIRPDLILLDVMMPEMDGYETCQQIKASPAWREIPIIFLTSKSDSADVVKGFELGAVDYVSKPFNSHELIARVHTHLTLDRLNRENQRLLLNVLPAKIAERLKKQEGIIAEGYEDVSVLFADIAGFTPLSAELAPTALVELLNHIFCSFDELVEQYGLEKIKTIGDSYMVAGGLLNQQPDHLTNMAKLSLAMLARVQELKEKINGVNLRIGLHVGHAVAGVIGIRKFSFDVWGETVNIASRLESHGVTGRVQVSHEVYEYLKDDFLFETRGEIILKGKGKVTTYFLQGPAPLKPIFPLHAELPQPMSTPIS